MVRYLDVDLTYQAQLTSAGSGPDASKLARTGLSAALRLLAGQRLTEGHHDGSAQDDGAT